MATVYHNTVYREEVTATAANPTQVVLYPEGVQNLTWTASVAASGTDNAIEMTVSSYEDIDAGDAYWIALKSNVTHTDLRSPVAVGDAITGASITPTAFRAVRNDQDITFVLTGSRIPL